MRVGFSTKVLLTAFLPVVLLLAGTFVALRILVDSTVRDNTRHSVRVLLRGGDVAAASLAGADPKDLARQLAACQGAVCGVIVNGQSYFTEEMPEAPLGDGYQVRTLQPAGRAGGGLRSTIERVFTVAAVAAFCLVFLVSITSARSIGRPLTAIVAGLRESERKGKLVPLDITTRVKEIEELTRALNQAARSIEESREKLARTQFQFIEAMASALDARDLYTAGHSRRVADYACATARELGLSEERIETIRVGALLHDVGKIGVPDAILLKPRELTPGEIAIVQLHPAIGRQILERIEGFEGYLAIVELHHENHDGSGYPHGLKGAQIPVETRIVHVVDAFDAMTSNRPYRQGMPPDAALARMQEGSGTQFDPEVVTAFLRTRKAPPRGEEPRVRDYVQLARGVNVAQTPALAEPD